MEIYWGSGCQMYVTPVTPQEVCVAVISRDSHLRFNSALAQFPELAGRLALASASTVERAARCPHHGACEQSSADGPF